MTSDIDDRPRVIVHMACSVDGRIQSRHWGGIEVGSLYEEVHASLNGDAWMCGRITMQGYTRGLPTDDTDQTLVPRVSHIVNQTAPCYAIALDFRGRLHWGTRNAIDEDHVVVVLSETVSDAHLNALRASGVSYIFGGRDTIDLAMVLTTLRREFRIRRLLVEGGGKINGSFLAAGLVDELNLLLAPAVDGGSGVPALFDQEGQTTPGTKLKLQKCEALDNGFVRLRYDVIKSVDAP